MEEYMFMMNVWMTRPDVWMHAMAFMHAGTYINVWMDIMYVGGGSEREEGVYIYDQERRSRKDSLT